MRKTIHILHKPSGTNLCEDGRFRSGVTFLYRGNDTLMYKTVGHALRRLNTRNPYKRIPEHMLKDCVLDVVETDVPGGFRAYRLDRHGNMVNDGHGGNSHEYAVA